MEYVDGDEDTGGWTAVEYLKTGDKLRLADGSAAFVTDVRNTGQCDTVYNFEVDGYHTYHVGQLGLWVHDVTCLVNRFTEAVGAKVFTNKGTATVSFVSRQASKIVVDNQYNST